MSLLFFLSANEVGGEEVDSGTGRLAEPSGRRGAASLPTKLIRFLSTACLKWR